MQERKMIFLAIVGLVVVASMLITIFGFLMLMNFGDGDKYDVFREYTVDGFIIESDVSYECTGTGRSVPIKETGEDHIYRFTFRITYSGTFGRELSFDLFCDKSGNPLESMYSKHIDADGKVMWSCGFDDITYEFPVEQYCKVPSVRISGNDIRADAFLNG